MYPPMGTRYLYVGVCMRVVLTLKAGKRTQVRAYDSCHYYGGPEVDMETLGRMLLGPRWALAIRVTLLLLLIGALSA
eukprot:7664431-Pyramimonas_sp.AAC.1